LELARFIFVTGQS